MQVKLKVESDFRMLRKMKIDMAELLIFFDELMPATDEEQGIYWFKTARKDGLFITFAFSIYESYVDIIIYNSAKIDIASLSLKNCSEIRILDNQRKCLEILHEKANGRCFLSYWKIPSWIIANDAAPLQS